MVARDGAPRRSARSVHTEIKNAKLSKDARRLHMLKKGLRKAQRGDPFFEDGRPDGNTAQVGAQGTAADPAASKPEARDQTRAEPASEPSSSGRNDAEQADRKRKQGVQGQRVQMGALKGVRRKPKTQMERRQDESEAQRAQDAEEGKAKAEERKKHLQQMQQREAQRKKEKKLMFKRNKKGQPVMKHRVEHILQGLGAV